MRLSNHSTPCQRTLVWLALGWIGLSPLAEAESRTRTGLVALYEFNQTEGEWVRDTSGVGQPVDLRITKPDAVQWHEQSLEITSSTQVRSPNPAVKLNEGIRRSGELTVEAWIQPKKTDQSGPARIVTLSRNGSERNFTLGQDGARYDFRIRTLETGNNGVPSLPSPKASLTPELTHVVYTRDRGGRAHLFLNGESVASKTVGGSTFNWHGQFRLALGNEFGGKRAWLGTYHLVAIYSRNLLPREIEHHFELGPQAATPDPAPHVAADPNAELFTHRIAPLLVEHCFECHDTATAEGKLDLSRRDTAFAGSSSGEVIVPGKPHESYLLESVLEDEMPEDRTPLAPEEKELLKEWIAGGASWPIEVIDPAAFVHGGQADENWLRRLTRSEYVGSVKSALGVDILEEAQEWLPKDIRADGFSNTAYNLAVDLKHVNAYARLADRIVSRLDITAFARQYTKSQLLTDKNMRGLIEKMGKQILRAPLEAHEIALFRGISTTTASAGGNFTEAVGLILEAMLQSPRFLYRIENQTGDGSLWPVSEHELAARMSYIIWGAPPDAKLIQAAESGRLFAPESLDQEIDRMLADPRAIARSREFVSEWLNLNRLDNLQPNPTKFPDWNVALAQDMRAETLAFFEEIAWNQKRPLADLFNASFTFASPELARHYGLKPSTAGIQRYDLSKAPGRGGLLTHGSVLTIGGDEASMVSRGLFVLHDLLRGVVKDPPPCVDTTPQPTRAGLTQRAIAEERVANAQCGGCHAKFEPLAFGLEKFDGIGAYHEMDEHGNVLREDGTILFPGTANAVTYQTAAELMDLLAKHDRVQESVTWKLTQFALGRPLVFQDAAIVESIHRAAQADGGSYQSLIAEIVKSDLITKTPTEISP